MKRTEKYGRIDLKATINQNKVVDIEMQLRSTKNFDKRTEFYGAKLITEQFGKGNQYKEFKPVILINILNYNLLEVPEYYTKTVTVAEKHREYEVIKDITYYFIELPKFRENRPRLANTLECWLALIDGKGELLEMAKEKEKIIKEANEEVEEILSESAIKELNDYIESAILDENSRISDALEEGIEKGKVEGKIEGKIEGKREGKREGQKEIITRMLKEKIDIETISKLTGLTKNEITKISEE